VPELSPAKKKKTTFENFQEKKEKSMEGAEES